VAEALGPKNMDVNERHNAGAAEFAHAWTAYWQTDQDSQGRAILGEDNITRKSQPRSVRDQSFMDCEKGGSSPTTNGAGKGLLLGRRY